MMDYSDKARKEREQGFYLCSKIQDFFGEGFEVRYDAGESGMTHFLYNGHLYKRVPNGDIKPNISIYDYKPTMSQLCEWR